jgi:hypothetical protein
MRFFLLVVGMLLLASCGGKGVNFPSSRPDTPLWTDDERQAIVAYWSAEGRYAVEPIGEPERINVTVGGSEWYAQFLVAVKTVPNDRQALWQEWVTQRITAEKARMTEALTGMPNAKRDQIPSADSMPEDLRTALGEPPALFERVRPLRYTVKFAKDDAEAPFVYTDNVPFADRKPYYSYYRSTNGVMKVGKQIRTYEGEERQKLKALLQSVGRSESEAKILFAVSALEGGFEAINTYDTGFVSIGFIQFITAREGNGSLGAVLAQYKSDDPAGFRADFHRFGIDVTSDKVIATVDPTTGAESKGEEAVRAVINDKRLTATFERAGLREGFRRAQVKVARERYFPGEDTVTAIIGGVQRSTKVSTIIKSEAGLATLMDRKVNRGNIRLLNDIASKVAEKYKVMRIEDLAKYEYEIVQALKFRTDFLTDTSLSQPQALPASPTRR